MALFRLIDSSSVSTEGQFTHLHQWNVNFSLAELELINKSLWESLHDCFKSASMVLHIIIKLKLNRDNLINHKLTIWIGSSLWRKTWKAITANDNKKEFITETRMGRQLIEWLRRWNIKEPSNKNSSKIYLIDFCWKIEVVSGCKGWTVETLINFALNM